MKKQLLQQICIAMLFLVISNVSYGQNYEGFISYKMEMMNPNSEVISDADWKKVIKEKFGENGFILQKYYYKQDKYISEISTEKEKGFQVYNPKDKLLYSWQLNSDTAITVDSRKYMDEFVEIVDNNKLDTILGIPCQSMTLKSAGGEMTIWYNKNHFKMDAKLYEGHLYGHWEYILKKIQCLPLKIEQKGFMTHIIQTLIAYKEQSVDESQFTIPKFKTIIPNPMN